MANEHESMEQPPQTPAQTQPEAVIHEIHRDSGFMPVLTMQEAQRRLNALKQFVRENMRRDVDYGIIPGTGEKPTLLKPGAEKLCTFFGLRSAFEIVEHTQDWEKGFFNYWYKCRLFRGEQCIAEGEGSANSLERKYRWRMVPLFRATDEERSRAVREETRRSKDGRAYKMLVLENEDPYTQVNTLQKMAQKRALIAATLIAVNASEFFTQDIEDMVVESDLEPHAHAETETPPHFQESQPAEESFFGLPESEAAAEGEAPGETRQRQAQEPAQPQEELTLKFKERPDQNTLQYIKSAGFRWDPKKVIWHASATPERQAVVEDLAKRGHLIAA